MSYKDRVKRNQGGTDIPKLDIGLRLTAKAKDNKPGFLYMEDVNGTKTEKHANFAVKGIYLGSGMVLGAYSKDLGAKGGSFHSTVYFRKSDTITLFGPTNSGYKKEMSGDLDKIEEFLTIKRRTISSLDKTKKQMVLFLLTEKKGLVEIRTNLTLGFDQLKLVQKQAPEVLISVTAGIYSENNPMISANAKKILGALAEKNPPCYCVISATDTAITDEVAEKYNLDKHLDDFERFKEYAANAMPEEPAEHASAPAPTAAPGSAFDDNPVGDIPSEPGDDLPFIITIFLAVGGLLPYLF